MAISERELIAFVEKALAQGVSRSEIARVLTQAGWSYDQISGALARFADIDFVVPVPRPSPYLPAREAFLYLVLFTALGFSAYHFGSVIFYLIETAFPDPAQRVSAATRAASLRWDIAYLVVAFPLYLWLAYKTASEAASSAEKRASRVRKWLTYLALGLAAIVIMGDLVALIYTYLNGELTVRVALKVLAVAAIAGSILWYYQRTMKRDEAAK